MTLRRVAACFTGLLLVAALVEGGRSGGGQRPRWGRGVGRGRRHPGRTRHPAGRRQRRRRRGRRGDRVGRRAPRGRQPGRWRLCRRPLRGPALCPRFPRNGACESHRRHVSRPCGWSRSPGPPGSGPSPRGFRARRSASGSCTVASADWTWDRVVTPSIELAAGFTVSQRLEETISGQTGVPLPFRGDTQDVSTRRRAPARGLDPDPRRSRSNARALPRSRPDRNHRGPGRRSDRAGRL